MKWLIHSIATAFVLCAIPLVADERSATGKRNSWAIQPLYEQAFPHASNGLAAVKFKGKWGYIDRSGKGVIPPQWDVACTFSGKFALVLKNDKWGYIDSTGAIVMEPTYEAASDFLGGVAVVAAGADFGTIGEDFRFIERMARDPEGPDASKMTVAASGKIRVRSGGGHLIAGWGRNFQNGGRVAIFQANGRKTAGQTFWDDASAAAEEGIALRHEGRLVLIGKGGVLFDSGTIAGEYPGGVFGSSGFREGLADVSVSFKGGFSRVGYADATGELVIPIRDFNGRPGFSNGLALFSGHGGGPLGYMDSTGSVVLKPQWQDATAFTNGGLAAVRKGMNDDTWVVIDKAGRAKFDIKTSADRSKGSVRVEPGEDHFRTNYGIYNEKGGTLPESVFSPGSEWVRGFRVAVLNSRWDDEKGGYTGDIALLNRDYEPVFGPLPAEDAEERRFHSPELSSQYHYFLSECLREDKPYPMPDPSSGKVGYVKLPSALPGPPPLGRNERPVPIPAVDDTMRDIIVGTTWNKTTGTDTPRRFISNGKFFSRANPHDTYRITGRREVTLIFGGDLHIKCRMNEECTEMTELGGQRHTWKRVATAGE